MERVKNHLVGHLLKVRDMLKIAWHLAIIFYFGQDLVPSDHKPFEDIFYFFFDPVRHQHLFIFNQSRDIVLETDRYIIDCDHWVVMIILNDFGTVVQEMVYPIIHVVSLDNLWVFFSAI